MKMWLAGVLLWCLATVTLLAGGPPPPPPITQYTITIKVVDVNNQACVGQWLDVQLYDVATGNLIRDETVSTDADGYAGVSVAQTTYTGGVFWFISSDPTALGVISSSPATAAYYQASGNVVMGANPDPAQSFLKLRGRVQPGGGIGG